MGYFSYVGDGNGNGKVEDFVGVDDFSEDGNGKVEDFVGVDDFIGVDDVSEDGNGKVEDFVGVGDVIGIDDFIGVDDVEDFVDEDEIGDTISLSDKFIGISWRLSVLLIKLLISFQPCGENISSLFCELEAVSLIIKIIINKPTKIIKVNIMAWRAELLEFCGQELGWTICFEKAM